MSTWRWTNQRSYGAHKRYTLVKKKEANDAIDEWAKDNRALSEMMHKAEARLKERDSMVKALDGEAMAEHRRCEDLEARLAEMTKARDELSADILGSDGYAARLAAAEKKVCPHATGKIDAGNCYPSARIAALEAENADLETQCELLLDAAETIAFEHDALKLTLKHAQNASKQHMELAEKAKAELKRVKN